MSNSIPNLDVCNLRGESSLGGTGSQHPYNFKIEAGEIAIVFGGKESSSLLRLLLGIGSISSGDVKVGGISIFGKKMSEEDTLHHRQRIGFAFRDKGLISNLSIKDNVDLPAKYHGYYIDNEAIPKGSLAESALRELEVPEEMWTHRPNRINWEIRKKVLLARAVVLNPTVLILDDPSAMAASPFIKFLLRWVTAQRKKGTAVLIGTDDYPFGIAVGDFFLHPTTGERTTNYSEFIEPCWIESASILKQRILASCT